MNPRLVTPVIVLVSFAATFGLTSWRAGLWRAAPDTAAVTVPARVAFSREASAAAAPPEAVPAVQPADEFLGGRNRATALGSRSH